MTNKKESDFLEKIEQRLRMTDDEFLATKINFKKQEKDNNKPLTPEMIEARFRETENY